VSPYDVDMTKESVIWGSMAEEHDKQRCDANMKANRSTISCFNNVEHVLTGWVHVHRLAVDEMWLMYGAPQEFGLTEKAYLAGNHTLDASPGAIARYKKHINENMARPSSKARVLCKTGDEPDFWTARRTWCYFSTEDTPRRDFTIVSFFKTRLAHVGNLGEAQLKAYPMHVVVYFMVTTTNDERGDFYTGTDLEVFTDADGDSYKYEG